MSVSREEIVDGIKKCEEHLSEATEMLSDTLDLMSSALDNVEKWERLLADGQRFLALYDATYGSLDS